MQQVSAVRVRNEDFLYIDRALQSDSAMKVLAGFSALRKLMGQYFADQTDKE